MKTVTKAPKQGEQIVQEKLEAAKKFLKNADLTIVFETLTKNHEGQKIPANGK